MSITRRMLMTGLALGALGSLAAPQALAAPFPVPETLPLEKEDYAEARRRFRTHLLKQDRKSVV